MGKKGLKQNNNAKAVSKTSGVLELEKNIRTTVNDFLKIIIITIGVVNVHNQCLESVSLLWCNNMVLLVLCILGCYFTDFILNYICCVIVSAELIQFIIIPPDTQFLVG